MNKFFPLIVVIILILIWNSAYTVNERERAILFNLGKIKDTEVQPGLHFQVPFVNNVLKFEDRILTFDSKDELFLTNEKKNLLVDFYVKWRISDVGLYYRSTRGQEPRAQEVLLQRIKDGLRNEFAKRTIKEAIAGERNEIMEQIVDVEGDIYKKMLTEVGIELVDVRVIRVDLPQSISESVYDRMSAERDRIASELRAEGREQAEILRAEADRESIILVANSEKEAQILRGEGDATAADIYATAYTQDKDFYSFYRSLESYRKAFTGGSDVMLLDPDSDFFRYLDNPQGN